MLRSHPSDALRVPRNHDVSLPPACPGSGYIACGGILRQSFTHKVSLYTHLCFSGMTPPRLSAGKCHSIDNRCGCACVPPVHGRVSFTLNRVARGQPNSGLSSYAINDEEIFGPWVCISPCAVIKPGFVLLFILRFQSGLRSACSLSNYFLKQPLRALSTTDYLLHSIWLSNVPRVI